MCGFARMSDRELTARLRARSWLYVAVQFLCLGVIALTGPLISHNGPLCIMEILGVALGVWSIIAIRPGNFNIVPDVVPGGRLVARGPYRAIRHPMYGALMLVTFPLVVDSFTLLRLLVWILLCVDLLRKLIYEEKLLASHYPEYTSYQMATKRLIPGIW